MLGGAGGLAGVTVWLFDAAGSTLLASTTSDGTGGYDFENLAAGVYIERFDRPTGLRFAVVDPGEGPDPITGSEQVDVDGDVTVNADYYANSPPVAINDTILTHENTAVTGNVLSNDADADGDTLTATVATAPTYGSLALNADGSFTYTPNTNYTGSDTFSCTAADGYGGTATATVSIMVANTPAPVGVSDSYTTPGSIEVSAAGGVLANDTDPNGSPLIAVLALGPAHGTHALNSDGSFSYIPDDRFVGTDSFSYLPTDDAGPGAVTAVSLTITDQPPVAVNDTATTNANVPVTIAVFSNDTDPDGTPLTVLGASDGSCGCPSTCRG